MKKKIMGALLALCMIANASAIDLYVDGRVLKPDSPPVILNSRTMVPLRSIFEALDAQVSWDNATRTATAVKGELTVKITADSTTAYVNGQAKTLDTPAQIVNSRTMVPLRFVSESLGAKVYWEADTQSVYVATVESFHGYRVAPETIFKTSSKENGFEEVFMFVEGKVTTVGTFEGYDYCTIETSMGTIVLVDSLELGELRELKVGDTDKFCFMYLDYDSETNAASGIYCEKGSNIAQPLETASAA